jgi:cytochrome c-type biogenesis protein CcmH/NrfG
MLPGDGGVVVGTGLCGQPGSDAGLCWALEAMVAMVAVAIVAFVCICIYAIWKIWNSDQ